MKNKKDCQSVTDGNLTTLLMKVQIRHSAKREKPQRRHWGAAVGTARVQILSRPPDSENGEGLVLTVHGVCTGPAEVPAE